MDHLDQEQKNLHINIFLKQMKTSSPMQAAYTAMFHTHETQNKSAAAYISLTSCFLSQLSRGYHTCLFFMTIIDFSQKKIKPS